MSKIRLTIFVLLAGGILAALVAGILLGHPQDMRMEASTL